jgi:hypothetical protein
MSISKYPLNSLRLASSAEEGGLGRKILALADACALADEKSNVGILSLLLFPFLGFLFLAEPSSLMAAVALLAEILLGSFIQYEYSLYRKTLRIDCLEVGRILGGE